MNDNDITLEALSGDTHVIASDADGAVGTDSSESSAQVASMTLAEINQELGKNFPTKEAALKSWKDTYAFVGKKQADAVALAKAELASTTGDISKISGELSAIRKDMFFKDNPQYAPYRAMIEKVPGEPSEVVNLPEFKDVLAKASSFDESQKLKTVLDSSPRLNSSRDALTKANELKSAGGTTDAVGKLVAQAVLDTLE